MIPIAINLSLLGNHGLQFDLIITFIDKILKMLIKSLYTFIVLLLFTTISVAQEFDKDNIYYRALKEYARYIERFEPETKTVYFEEVKGITAYFPKEINGLKIVILTARNQVEIYAKNDGQIIHRKMSPAQIVKNKIDVGIIPYQGQYSPEQGGLRLGLSKWHNVIFVYDEKSKSFKYKELQNNG